MRLPATVVLALLVCVVGCDDASSPVAPTLVEPEIPTLTYVSVYRGRCPADSDLPFSVRENGWFWADSCRNDHGEIVELRAWCSGARRVDRDVCVLNTPASPPPVVPPPTTSTLSVTGPTSTVPDDGCVTYGISGGTAPYRLTSFGGRWVTSAPCQSHTPTRYTLPAPGQAVWSATGLGAGDAAYVTITDADGARVTFTLNVI